MELIFTKKEIDTFSLILGKKPDEYPGTYIWHTVAIDAVSEAKKSLYFSLHLPTKENGLELPIASVQTLHGYYELHNIVKYMTFEPDEIIFIAENDDKLSSLIVGSQGTCSLYSNISKNLLNADFSTLSAPNFLAATQLSILDTIIEREED
jgi:hypothetical protein